MPHIIVEYTDSNSLDVPELLNDLHKTLASHDTINLQAIKTRAIKVKYPIVGAPTDSDQFVHITVKLLEGRPEELRKAIGASLYDKAKSYLTGSSEKVSLSLEVAEMNPATYVK